MNDKDVQQAVLLIAALETKNRELYPMWRRGQNLFNSLHDLYPSIANGLRATDIDPFYDNKRYGACWTHIITVLKTDDFQP